MKDMLFLTYIFYMIWTFKVIYPVYMYFWIKKMPPPPSTFFINTVWCFNHQSSAD